MSQRVSISYARGSANWARSSWVVPAVASASYSLTISHNWTAASRTFSSFRSPGIVAPPSVLPVYLPNHSLLRSSAAPIRRTARRSRTIWSSTNAFVG